MADAKQRNDRVNIVNQGWFFGNPATKSQVADFIATGTFDDGDTSDEDPEIPYEDLNNDVRWVGDYMVAHDGKIPTPEELDAFIEQVTNGE